MKKDAISKSKFRTLKRRLGKPHYAVVGVLEALWLTAQIDAADGAIGRLSNEEIAASLEWDGDADELIKSLVDCCWLDEDDEFRLVVHDWSDHVPNYVKGAFKINGKQFADQSAKQRAKQGAKHIAKRPAKHGAKQEGNSGEHPARIAPSYPILSNSSQSDPVTSVTTAAPDFPESLNTDAFQEMWADWKRHRVEIKKPLKPTQVAKQLKWLAELGEAAAIATIEFTIEKGWQGLRCPEGLPASRASRLPTDEEDAAWTPYGLQ